MLNYIDQFWFITPVYNHYGKLRWPVLIYYNPLQSLRLITLTSFESLQLCTITMTNGIDWFGCITTIYNHYNQITPTSLHLVQPFTITMTHFTDQFWLITTIYMHYGKLHWPVWIYYNHVQSLWQITLTSLDISQPCAITMASWIDQLCFIATMHNHYDELHWLTSFVGPVVYY